MVINEGKIVLTIRNVEYVIIVFQRKEHNGYLKRHQVNFIPRLMTVRQTV